jgi:hypothetical protein
LQWSYLKLMCKHHFTFDNYKNITQLLNKNNVATLTLGSWPKQRFVRLRAKREARSHTTYSQKCEKVWGNEPSQPKGVPLWELESRWTLTFLEGNCKGQNSMAWGVHYIIGKLLERKYLKWARIAHLDIWNTSHGQKKGQESNW